MDHLYSFDLFINSVVILKFIFAKAWAWSPNIFFSVAGLCAYHDLYDVFFFSVNGLSVCLPFYFSARNHVLNILYMSSSTSTF